MPHSTKAPDSPTIFTKIYNGDIPGRVLYEDDQCYVLLTHEPMTPGHCLVIPRQEIDHVWDLPDELYTHVMNVARKMASWLDNTYDYKRIGMCVEGFGVPHAHVHVYGYTEPLEETIQHHIENREQISPDEMEEIVAKIHAANGATDAKK